MERNGVDKVLHNKKILLDALEASLGVVTKACKETGISRTTFYNYLHEDEEFAKSVKEIENVAIDFAESALHEQIKNGNSTSTIFYLKTKGKGRGYVEKTEVDNTIRGVNIQIAPDNDED